MAKQSLKPKFLFLLGRFALLAIGSAGLGAAIGLAVVFFRNDQQLYAIAALALGLFFSALLISLTSIISMLYRVLEHYHAQAGFWHIAQDQQRQQEALLTQISENILISDGAKEVVYRDHDRELLKNAIQEDIEKADWEAAYQLLEQMQSRFGYSREAAQFRRLVDSQRVKSMTTVIEETRAQAESLCNQAKWHETQSLLDSLAKQFPSSPQVREMSEKMVPQRRNEHKQALLESWHEAVQNEHIDRGIELLQELDQYLTPAEAADLKDSARGMFKAKLQNLGVAFSVAINERRWTRALEIGQEIVTEFPNSRMAEEVKGKFEIIEKRAQEQARA